MRALFVAMGMSLLVGVASRATAEDAHVRDYDSCEEVTYDSKDEPCGGGHQHTPGKRDVGSQDLARHRHRFYEDQISKLTERVTALEAELKQLKGK